MNLGSIKDKSGKGILGGKRLTKICSVAAVCCVAVVAVTSAIAIKNKSSEEPYVLEASQTSTPEEKTATPTPKAQMQSGEAEVAETTPAGSETVTAVKMAMPLSGGNVLKGYASDMLLYSATLKHWCTHNGLDLAVTDGAQVVAALDGTVAKVEDDALMGKKITLSHNNGCETVYASLDTIDEAVTEGATVIKGQSLGTAGTSASCEAADGAHLHFEVYVDGKSINPQTYLSDLIK